MDTAFLLPMEKTLGETLQNDVQKNDQWFAQNYFLPLHPASIASVKPVSWLLTVMELWKPFFSMKEDKSFLGLTEYLHDWLFGKEWISGWVILHNDIGPF